MSRRAMIVAFEPFHRVGLSIGLVIVAHEMQKAMHREMGEMMQERLGLRRPHSRAASHRR